MNKISSIKSMKLFNERVLSLGVINDRDYTFEELKQKLFFNKVFMSNSDELFSRYHSVENNTDHIKYLTMYCNNINSIIDNVMGMNKSIRISIDAEDDSFEKRLISSINIHNYIISDIVSIDRLLKFPFKSNTLYYISKLEYNPAGVMISYIDPRKSIYEKLLSYEFPDYTMYWKTDECIRAYIENVYNSMTVTIKVTNDIDNKPAKIEASCYHKGLEWFKNLLKNIQYSNDVYYLPYPFLYTDDIEKIIDTHIETNNTIIPEEDNSFELNDVFNKDILIEYPNQSFNTYLRLLALASSSPDVESIYLTLYRVGNNPVIYYILRDAVRRGIKVHVNIELYASGEDINEFWAKEMENAGIYVTHYAAGLYKVHSKLTLIKLNNGKKIAQIGTGNYHTKTTTQYTDLSLITSDKSICSQISKVFDIIAYKKVNDISFNEDLLVTQYKARKYLYQLIDEQSALGENGYIAMKCNSLDDDGISYRLNKAASNGCIIHLVVRGICTWIPPIENLNKNVIIKSIVWDMLEHSRVYCFGNDNPTTYIGSLDMVKSKIDNRIETLVKIKDPFIIAEIYSYMNRYIMNKDNSWKMVYSEIESNQIKYIEYIKE